MKNDLKNVIEDLGKSPLEEVELGEILLSTEKNTFRAVEDIWNLVCEDKDISDYPTKDLEDFFKNIRSKITDFYEEDGTLKATKLTKAIKPLSFFEAAKYKATQVDIAEIKMKMQSLDRNISNYLNQLQSFNEKDTKKIEDFVKKNEKKVKKMTEEVELIPGKLEALNKELEELSFKYLKKDSITDWEKELYRLTVDFLVVNPEKTVQGKNS